MGTTQDAFTQIEPIITLIQESDLIGKNRTMNAITGETSALVVTATEDRAEFKAVPRFDISKIDTLQLRLDGYLYTYAQFEEIAFNKSESLTQWDSGEDNAYKVKRKLLRRLITLAEEAGDTAELAELKKISKGRGREDLTMDFLLLAGKARKYQVELATLNYQEDEIIEVEAIFETLKSLLGSINRPNSEIATKKLLMEQAYTYLAQAVNSIQSYGRMIFEDTDREDLYKSASRQEYGSMSHKNDSLKEEDQSTLI